MSCRTIYLNDTLIGNSAGGTWSYDGYSSQVSGPPSSGGTDPGDISGENPLIETEGWIAGYYFFSYTIEEEDCEPISVQVIIAVQDKGSAGTGGSETYCYENNSTIQLFDLLNSATAGGTWSLSANSPNNPGGAANYSNGTLNLASINSAGTFIFDYVVDINDIDGFETINCILCRSLSSVTIITEEPCDPGISNTISYSSKDTSIILFNNLNGTPDINGSWEQISGETEITIEGGYLGEINLLGAEGCEYVFRYTCPGVDGCERHATVTLIKNAGLQPLIIDKGDGLLFISSDPGCFSEPTYQWQEEINGVFVDIPGATEDSYQVVDFNRRYRLVYICEGCDYFSNSVFVPLDCNCNNEGLAFEFNPQTDCLSILPTGETCSPVESDVIEYRINGTGSWIQDDEVCGCDLRQFLDVNPTCNVSGNNIQVGFNNPQRCSGNIDRVYIKYGNGALTTEAGSDITSTFFNVNKNDFINLYNRSAVLIVRLNLGSNVFLHQEISFFYSGDGSGGSGCNDVAVLKINFPKLFNSIEARRTVTYTDPCPPTVFIDTWSEPNPCSNFYVLIQQVNVGQTPSLSGDVFNCANPSRQWYLNGVALPGETGFFLNLTTYGDGFYELVATGCGCSGIGSISVGGCSNTLNVTENNGTYTATFTGCAGNRTWYWERLIGSSYVIQQTVTNSSNSNSYTPTVSGQYRIRVVCVVDGCPQAFEFPFSVICTVSVSLSQVGANLIATATNCSGNKTYVLQRWNGTSWIQVNPVVNTTSNTASWTPTFSGLYRVELTCEANGCFDDDQAPFSVDCDITVNVSGPSNGVYTGSVTNCPGTKTWTWKVWNGFEFQTIASTTNSNATNTFAPSVAGTFMLMVNCAANGCENFAIFDHEINCNITALIIPNLPNLQGACIGCSGAITYVWYRRATPGSGAWGAPISNNQIINTDIYGTGEYRLDIISNGCSETATIIVGPQVSVTLDCNQNNPFTAVVNPAGGTFQWQYSPAGTGWINLGTAQTQMPTQGTGFYRVIYFYPNAQPVSATCQYQGSCDGNATLTPTNDKCNWSCPIGSTEAAQILTVVINGSTALTGTYNLDNSTDRNTVKGLLETWLSNNNYGGTVTWTTGIYGKFGVCLNILCTKANPTRCDFGSNTTWFGNCGKNCTYVYDIPEGDPELFVIAEWQFSCISNAPYSKNFISQASEIQSDFQNDLNNAGFSGTVTVNTANRTITISGTNAAIGTLSAGFPGPGNSSDISATQSSCGTPSWVFPTLNLSVNGCAGSQIITWNYRPNSSAPWTIVQNGGSSYSTCVSGQYFANVQCGDCSYDSNIITV